MQSYNIIGWSNQPPSYEYNRHWRLAADDLDERTLHLLPHGLPIELIDSRVDSQVREEGLDSVAHAAWAHTEYHHCPLGCKPHHSIHIQVLNCLSLWTFEFDVFWAPIPLVYIALLKSSNVIRNSSGYRIFPPLRMPFNKSIQVYLSSKSLISAVGRWFFVPRTRFSKLRLKSIFFFFLARTVGISPWHSNYILTSNTRGQI